MERLIGGGPSVTLWPQSVGDSYSKKERNMIKRALIVTLLLTSASAFAEPVVLKSNFDSTAGPNSYEVVLPPELGGGDLFMPIVGGSFELKTDAALGTAELLTWSQQVSPIDIFGMSTGPIEIVLAAETPSTGTFDSELNQFEVTGTFLIKFDDTQLRQVGFFSPIALEGTERGTIYGAGSIGTVRMFLEGQGGVAGQTFTYTCKTSARFEYKLEPNQAQPGDVNHDRNIDVSDAVTVLGSLFQGAEIACAAAAEVNADALIDLSDAVYLLNFLFQGGPAPQAAPVTCAE